MKAKEGIVAVLNKVLTLELTAVHQYLLHASICGQWGYERLRHKLHALATEEMGHAAQLMNHILYLEGTPDVQSLGEVKSGSTVTTLFEEDLQFEMNDASLLQEAITHSAKVGDYTTRHKLEEMIKETDEHIDWFETQLRTIKQVGAENYLSEQMHR
jgi:bacterioferritin